MNKIKASLYFNSTDTSLPNAYKCAIIISAKALLNMIRSDKNVNRNNYQAAAAGAGHNSGTAR